MKANESGKENNYTLLCVWQLRFIPLAHQAKIKGDILECVFSAFNGVAVGCVWRRAFLAGPSPGMVALPLVPRLLWRAGGSGGKVQYLLPKALSSVSAGFP